MNHTAPKSTDTKECTECGREKVLTDFHRLSAALDGRMSVCKDCRRKQPAVMVQRLLGKVATLEGRISRMQQNHAEEVNHLKSKIALYGPRFQMIAELMKQVEEKIQMTKEISK